MWKFVLCRGRREKSFEGDRGAAAEELTDMRVSVDRRKALMMAERFVEDGSVAMQEAILKIRSKSFCDIDA